MAKAQNVATEISPKIAYPVVGGLLADVGELVVSGSWDEINWFILVLVVLQAAVGYLKSDPART